MQLNQQEKKGKKYISGIISAAKMKLGCFASVTMRCLCPFEEEMSDLFTKNKEGIIRALLYFSLSFVLGLSKLKQGMLPFGLAILCAGYGKNTVFCFCGAALSCLFEGIGGLIQFITLALIYFLRRSITGAEFSEGIAPRLLTAFFSSAFTGACTLFSRGFSGELILSYLTYVALSVFSTYLFSGALALKKEEVSNSLRLLSVYSLCVCMIPAFNRLSFLSIDLGLIFSCVCSLWISRCRGPVYGCVAGFIFGFGCINPLFSAPLGIGCLVSAFIMTKSFLSAVCCFPLFTFFVYVYLFGTSSISSFIPFTVCGALIYLAIHKSLPSGELTANKAKKASSPAAAKNSELMRVSDSLSGLSAVIYKFAEHLKAPGNAETEKVIDNAFSEICACCSMKAMCYAKRECNLPSAKSKIISRLHANQLKEDELSSLLLHKCIKVRELCSFINSHYSELYFMTMKSNRTQTVAQLYNSMSRLMKSATKQETENNTRDERLERIMGNALKRIGIDFTDVIVSGKRCKNAEVHGIRPDKIPCSSKDLCEYLSDECKICFGEPTFDISESADIIMKFSRAGIISLEYAQCCKPKKDETVNGDTVSFFESDSNYFYSLIADGMGSGKSAAATSRLACVFLEKMLCCGTSKNVCIEMLNNLLLSKNDETFSGIDLLEIDRLTGNACFIKAGAAPSFVLRKSRLYKIYSETPPVGIIPSFSAESTRFSLEKGDIIFMVSDGIVSSDADAVWLSELIDTGAVNDPEFLARTLIEKSEELGKTSDDASACVIRIN